MGLLRHIKIYIPIRDFPATARFPPQGARMPSESRVFPRTPAYLGTLCLLWVVAYGSALFRPALLDDADSVHAEAAREIVLSHDWVTLHANGIRYLEKAPLLYWAVAASFELFGIHDWSARLPLAIGALALLVSVYFLGRRSFGEAAGFYSALASGLALGPYLFTRFLIPDILVGLWLILSLGFFLRAFEEAEPSRFACWGLAASCALNVLTKGLIGLVFAIAAPWHILAGLRNPTQGNVRGFFWFYFVNEHLLRYLNKRVPRDYGTVPLLLFWGLLLVWLFPWSSFLPQALANVKFSRIRESIDSPAARAKLLFLLGAFFVVLFFSFSTLQEYYVLPALPSLALLIGSWLAEEESSPAGSRLLRWGKISSTVLVILGLLVGILSVALAIASPPVSPGADIASLLNSAPA